MTKEDAKFSQTGFIIGAGAHVPYGMPISSQLTEKIKELNYPKKKVITFKPPSKGADDLYLEKIQLCKIIADQNLIDRSKHLSSLNSFEIEVGKQLDNFLDTFAGSQVYSIDAFLAKYIKEHKAPHEDILIQIGKIVLIYFIHKYESSTPVGYHRFDWIQFLINNFLKDPKSKDIFFSNPPRISTFNYDRILERSLLGHLVNYHGTELNEAIEQVKSLKIRHFYGDLAEFNEAFDINNPKHIASALKRIRVIGEERLLTVDNESEKFFKEFKDLKNIYILGYGFDELNNNLLFSNFKKSKIQSRTQFRGINVHGNEPSLPNFYSTNIGLTEESCREIYNNLDHIHVDLVSYGNALGKVDSLELLKIKHPYQQAIKEDKGDNSFSTDEETYFGTIDDDDY